MTILVTGATGTVGRLIVDELARNGHHVRALTRDPAKADLPEGVEVVAGDLAEPGSLTAAFEGVEAVHLINFAGDDYAPLKTGEQSSDESGTAAPPRSSPPKRRRFLRGAARTPCAALAVLSWGGRATPSQDSARKPLAGDSRRRTLTPSLVRQ